MQRQSSFISAIQKLREAKEYLQDYARSRNSVVAVAASKKYIPKIEWLIRDIITTPGLNPQVAAGIKHEWERIDGFDIDAIQKKIALLRPEIRPVFEELIDRILAGEELKIEMQ